jgi:hypothetical protein
VLVGIDPHANISVPMRCLLLLTAVVCLLATGCGTKPSPNVYIDPALAVLVPPDTIALAGVRMEQLSKTPFYKEWVEKRKLSWVEEFRRRSGLDPTRDLWEVLITSDGKSSLVLIRGRFAEHGIEPKLDLEGAKRFSYKGYTLIGNDEHAVVFLNPTTAAAGRTPDLHRLVDRRNEVTGLPAGLESRARAIPSSNQAWFVANIAGHLPAAAGEAPGMFAGIAGMLKTVQFASGGLDVRQTFRSNITIETGNEQEAEQLRGALRALLGLGRLNTSEDRREMLTVFDGMQVSRETKVVRFSTDVPFDLLEKAAAQFPTRRAK